MPNPILSVNTGAGTPAPSPHTGSPSPSSTDPWYKQLAGLKRMPDLPEEAANPLDHNPAESVQRVKAVNKELRKLRILIDQINAQFNPAPGQQPEMKWTGSTQQESLRQAQSDLLAQFNALDKPCRELFGKHNRHLGDIKWTDYNHCGALRSHETFAELAKLDKILAPVNTQPTSYPIIYELMPKNADEAKQHIQTEAMKAAMDTIRKQHKEDLQTARDKATISGDTSALELAKYPPFATKDAPSWLVQCLYYVDGVRADYLIDFQNAYQDERGARKEQLIADTQGTLRGQGNGQGNPAPTPPQSALSITPGALPPTPGTPPPAPGTPPPAPGTPAP